MDDHTRYTWVYQLLSSPKLETTWNHFSIWLKRNSLPLLRLKSDNGPEFHIPLLYVAKGTMHQYFVLKPYNRMPMLKESTSIYLMLLDLSFFNLICLSVIAHIVLQMWFILLTYCPLSFSTTKHLMWYYTTSCPSLLISKFFVLFASSIHLLPIESNLFQELLNVSFVL